MVHLKNERAYAETNSDCGNGSMCYIKKAEKVMRCEWYIAIRDILYP